MPHGRALRKQLLANKRKKQLRARARSPKNVSSKVSPMPSSPETKSTRDASTEKMGIRNVFALFDRDSDGSISLDELHRLANALGKRMSRKQLVGLLSEQCAMLKSWFRYLFCILISQRVVGNAYFGRIWLWFSELYYFSSVNLYMLYATI